MSRLVEGLSRFFGRVEILARGGEGERRAAEAALAKGRALDARDAARDLLERVPGSPLGLALWADAAEDAWLDHEVVAALSELAEQVPWRADVWLRLGRAGARIGWPGARGALERAATATEEAWASREALLELCDLDLAVGDAARAEQWLDRARALGRLGREAGAAGAERGRAEPVGEREVALRIAECALARGDGARAASATAPWIEDSATDGRTALVRARIALLAGDSVHALDAALRAFVLDAPGAVEVLTSVVAASRDVVVVDRVRRVVAAAEQLDSPAWDAAFALAEGRADDARRALLRGVEGGDARAAAALLALAVEARDAPALHALAERAPGSVPADVERVLAAIADVAAERGADALDRLDGVPGGGAAAAWAAEVRRSIVAEWVPVVEAGRAPASADWPRVLAELGRVARRLERLDLLGTIETLAIERERPLRVAVVGEFNAGKSTFINALIGVDVAPTGVLPTTATLHWVAWAPDAFARVVVRGSPDRVVPHAELKATLRAVQSSGARVERVAIYAPIERLKRVEILDTPGFNAPDPDHVAAARTAFDEAHVAIWLLDANQPMKETERRVLDEIRALGVPIQILANKADRLGPEERARVLSHIEAGLAEAGLTSFAPPVAFSARQALAGRLGDEAALAQSGWEQVEAFMTTRIVDASDGLRERGLRRKALVVAERLAAEASRRATAAQQAVEEQRALRAAREHAASKLGADRANLGRELEKTLEPVRHDLAADLRPLARAAEGAAVSEGARAFARERFVARLAAPACTAVARVAGVDAPPRVFAAVRDVLAGAAAAMDSPETCAERPLAPVLEAAVSAFATALVELPHGGGASEGAAVLEARALALRDALAGGQRAA